MASQSSSIKVAVKGSGKAVDVSVTAGEHAWVYTHAVSKAMQLHVHIDRRCAPGDAWAWGTFLKYLAVGKVVP